VQECTTETTCPDPPREAFSGHSKIELPRPRLDDELNQRKSALNALERKLLKNGVEPDRRAEVEEERRRAKADLERVRRSLREATHIADTLERDVEEGFNPFWGLLFKA